MPGQITEKGKKLFFPLLRLQDELFYIAQHKFLKFVRS